MSQVVRWGSRSRGWVVGDGASCGSRVLNAVCAGRKGIGFESVGCGVAGGDGMVVLGCISIPVGRVPQIEYDSRLETL